MTVVDKNPDSYASVQHWMEVVNARYALSGREWEERLDVLWNFCDSLGKDPDAIIKDALDERNNKLDYMRHLRRWSKEQAHSESSAHELQNVVRSFFINNGARVLTKPYPDVYGSRGS